MNVQIYTRTAVAGMSAGWIELHPFAESVSVDTVAWARRYGLVAGEREAALASQIRVGNLAAYTFRRDAPTVVQLGADLILWLYLFDDAIGEAPPGMGMAEHRAVVQTYVDLLRTGEFPSQITVFHEALQELRERAQTLGATSGWLRRFADDMEGYFTGCVEETPYRRGECLPGLIEYRNLRALTVGTRAVFAVLELGECGVVCDREMDCADVAEVRRLAALLTAWVNDVYSYPKEAAVGDPLNVVSALTRALGGNPQHGLDAAVDVYNLELHEFELLKDEIIERGCSAELASYLEGLVIWVHGNRAWTKECGRYF